MNGDYVALPIFIFCFTISLLYFPSGSELVTLGLNQIFHGPNRVKTTQKIISWSAIYLIESILSSLFVIRDKLLPYG
jgi:hypothetical protein